MLCVWIYIKYICTCKNAYLSSVSLYFVKHIGYVECSFTAINSW